ncbi:iron-containing alcohol dehydrogenase [Candidatus Sumerlaeota bacterium]|nr:iron-containing alcohol dehydrogenase [Candidatus Sumerlaeota bacterium]
MRFEFATANRIIFGAGSLGEIAPMASEMGNSAFIVTGKNPDRAANLLNLLQEVKIHTVTFSLGEEPTTHLIMEGIQKARDSECNIVIGFGGGSVIDAGKAIAALLSNQGDLFDYLEVIGKAKPLENPPLPYIAIPTTAGTGAEVTRNAVILSPEHKVKVSMRSPLMLPRLALVDPLLTHSMPSSVTASTGLDALTQLIEPFLSKKANPVTDGFCREGLRLAARSLKNAFDDGSNAPAREGMALASLFGGLALANSALGAVHGFAGPVGGMFPAPHGIICARLLPFAMETNYNALKNRTPNSPALERFQELAWIFTGNPAAKSEEAVSWIKNLCDALNVPHLSEYRIKKDDIPLIVEMAKNSSSMKGNPIELTDEELAMILDNAL